MIPGKHYLPEGNFSNDSRTWIYQSNRPFSIAESLEIAIRIKQFAAEWRSHGNPVKGSAWILFDRFIIIMADERATGVSGCSTDSSIRMIRDFEQQYGLTMFDRKSLAFWIEEKIELVPFEEIQKAYDSGMISPETLYFNNLVQTKEEFEKNWITPVKNSWLATKIRVTSSS
ncbi:MAG TPA: hypothetical protein VLJ68_04520 [Chitinophagaceae bacterium]|nr:hypothetical protein [Chitinophagaceae bacterium]